MTLLTLHGFGHRWSAPVMTIAECIRAHTGATSHDVRAVVNGPDMRIRFTGTTQAAVTDAAVLYLEPSGIEFTVTPEEEAA